MRSFRSLRATLNPIHYRSLRTQVPTLTTFVLSHNPQVYSQSLPSLSATDLADGLAAQTTQDIQASGLEHPHWKVKVESSLPPNDLAQEILQSWRRLRTSSGIKTDFTILALGGRKDGVATPNSLLQPGAWGVDIVETHDTAEFLKSINWSNLKAGRPDDALLRIFLIN